jgi:SAM-dependent methyltransferase
MLFFARPINTYDYQEYYPYLAEFDRRRFEWEIGIRRPKFARQLRTIKRFAPQATALLDVGAGPGYLCAVANELGFKALGVEPSDDARKAGERQFAVTYTELDAVPDESVDVIMCHHVLEHIEWPAQFLATLRAKMRPGGILALHVPNQQPLSFLLREKAATRPGQTYCTLYHPIHINGFTSQSLARVVGDASFEVVALRNVSMWSSYYDPFFLANYFRQSPPLVAALKVSKHAARCAVDVLGNPFGRGDWVVGHFRAA